MCIFCYLDTYKQYKIRKGIQLRTDRFEHTIEKYKLSFISKFEEHISLNLCSKHENDSNNNILLELKEIPIDSIKNFFDCLRRVYIDWIDSRPLEALNIFKEVLAEHNIWSNAVTMDGSILFRGRQSKAFLSHWDMFHIPFNKRYCIGNQRYSLVGQPLLYLASSPYCVFKELFTTEDVKLSSFLLVKNESENISDSSDPYLGNNLKLFDNTNTIDKYVKSNDDLSMSSSIDDLVSSELTSESIEPFFFKYILANCCSFSLNNSERGNTFSEEYVLPQLLSQIIKDTGFDGIVFNSTRCYDEESICMNSKTFNLLCKNICIFTKYNFKKIDDITYVYDKDLYQKFSISSTLAFEKNSVDHDYYDIDKSLSIFNKLMSYNPDLFYSNLLMQISEYLCCYKDLLNGDNFTKSLSEQNKNLFFQSINLHALQLRNMLLDIYDKYNRKEIV
ncbi:hypothetical protein BJV38_004198 [Clostridium beijerinckii]|uniref:hypothetical protein n=1 Tax=Clostridium beijerinckii TaxID=1520 RepID=UPI00156E51AC|nr:hypothetical protein [Clostridium beijerinckii]NRT33219.1 hypothetical protein [Clostridium beijerinckii]NRT47355.1 hypothetical protein [Clostridium beijerinckii]NRZ18640.1 hypothetical protein [Clostridium beijerinckii]